MIDSFSKLPIGKYLEILKVDKDETLLDIDRQAEILAILEDSTAEEIMERPLLEYKALVAQADFLHHPIPDVNFNRVAKSYSLGGWELVPVTDIRKITTSQYVDFQTFSKQGEDKMVEVLSCFLVPKGKKYADGYDIIELQSILRECLSVADVVSLSAFFFYRFAKSIKGMLTYSKRVVNRTKLKLTQEQRQEMWNRIQEQMTLLQTNGDGSQQ